jgi:ArsR family transcriptional regulator, arsenate/arsenite/antimonite-responsive transcriptional repressor
MTKKRIERDGIDIASRIGKAIDHPLRVRALAALRDGELCVCELIELLGLAPSTVSKHMAVIADAGLVERRRDGRWTYYSLSADPEPAIACAVELVMTLVEDDPVVAKDRRRLPNVRCSQEG